MKNFLDFFRRKPKMQQRGYREVCAVGGQNSDWPLIYQSEDSDVWQNGWALTTRVRDLFRTNPIYQAYRETLWANVFGAEGIMLRMTVSETGDRVVHTPGEARCIENYEKRRNRVMEWAAGREGREFKREALLHVSGQNGSRAASVKAGQPDIYANTLIERRWKEWQRREFADARGARTYQTIRQLRLISAVRDGDFFLRMVRDRGANKFGFTLQLVNSEWCDRFLNWTLGNGNVIRMGIEYQSSTWGAGKPVAYYFIKRQPQDWQFATPGSFTFQEGKTHDRIPANEIVHYARVVDADSTRPAPWVASTIPSSRQRDQAMLAETIAWRAAACKTGWLESTVVPEGGFAGDPPNPQNVNGITIEPGGLYGLPYGVTYKDADPRHPNANVEEFRKASLRDGCAGMPGANYSTMANDYEAINFSAGRLQRLDTNENNMLLQEFDIDYAENPIFEAWLEMALITGQVPLPLAKLEKFNNKVFAGRRWQGVDEVKENNADALAVANKFTSRTRVCAGRGRDFEEVALEIAEENMLLEGLGLTTITTAETPPPAPADTSGDGGNAPAKQSKAKKSPRQKIA